MFIYLKIGSLNDSLLRLNEEHESFKRNSESEKLRLQAQITDLSEARSKADSNSNNIANKLRTSENELQRTLKKQTELSTEIKSLQENIAYLQSEIEEKRKAIDAKVQLIGQQAQELSRIKLELRQHEEKLESVEGQLAVKSTDFQNLERYLNEERKEKQEEINQYIDELEAAKTEMSEMRFKLEGELEHKKQELLKLQNEKNQVFIFRNF